MADGHFSATRLFDGIDQCREVFVDDVDDDLTGQLAVNTAQKILRQEGRHHFTDLLFYTDLREEVLAAQHPAAPHANQVHTGTARIDERGNHVHIACATVHALLVLNAPQQRNLITQLGRALEIQRHRGLFHRGVQLIAQCIAAPFEKHHRVTHVFGVHIRLDKTDARPLAAFDLILQTRAVAVLEKAVFALAYLKGLLQQAQAFTNGTGAGIRPEIATLGLLCTAMNAQPRVGTVGQEHIRIGLIITQQDVVRRPPLFDEGLFQQQRFGFVVGDRGFDLGDARNQCAGLGCVPGLAKVAGKTLLEVLGLADVQQRGVGIEHAINARATATGREKCTWIECLGHVQALASTMP